MIKEPKTTWVKNSLGFDNETFIYQDKTMFNYSIDTILLANFMSLNSKVKNILEIGTNNGALSIFLSLRSSKIKIDALEIQPSALELATYNVNLNQKESQINLIADDFNIYYVNYNKMQRKKYDAIICNPPFYQKNFKKIPNISESKKIAIFDEKLSLEQLISGASKIIEQMGYLTIVLPTERAIDYFYLARKYNFEPKRVQFIHPRVKDKSILFLAEARFNSGWGTTFLPNLYLHPDDPLDHSYLEEIKQLYKPKKV